MESITGLGVRDVGSVANEIQAPAYILDTLKRLAASFDNAVLEDNSTRPSLDIDTQIVSGSFELDFLQTFTNSYSNLTNIVARLSWPESSRYAVLVNAHYDSAWCSTGASDDAIQVGTALEMIRALGEGPPLPVSIIFLLNGGEETILQAAHGFITQHDWAQYCRVVINLEAAGVGGRELLFQTGPGNEWLIAAYARAAPYPHASVIAQDIFQSGLIPGETDYRIFRDFGGIPGFDAAFIKDGYVYHTDLDNSAKVRANAGAVKRCGENFMRTLRAVAAAPEMLPALHRETPASGFGTVWEANTQHGSAVFFDVLGLFVVRYSKLAATALHLGLAGLAGLLFLGECVAAGGLINPLRGAFAALLTAAAGLLVNMGTAWLLTFGLQHPQAWFARPQLIAALYGAPAALAHLLAHHVAGTALRLREAEVFWAGVGGATAATLALTWLGVGSAYAPFQWVWAPVAARAAAGAVPRGLPATAVQLLGFAVPLLVTGQMLLEVLVFLVPVLGRAGVIPIPVDAVVAAVGSVAVSIMLHPLLALGTGPAEHRPAPRGAAAARPSASPDLSLLLVLLVGSVAVGVQWSLLYEPYSVQRPKRMFLQRVVRQVYGFGGEAAGPVASDSGMLIHAMDMIQPDYILDMIRQSNRTVPPHIQALLAQPRYAPYTFGADNSSLSVPAPPWGDFPDGAVELKELYGEQPWILPVGHMLKSHVYLQGGGEGGESSGRPRERVAVEVLTDTAQDSADDHRYLHLRIRGGSRMVIVINADEASPELRRWNVTPDKKVPPAHDGSHYILHTTGVNLIPREEATKGGEVHPVSAANESEVYHPAGRGQLDLWVSLYPKWKPLQFSVSSFEMEEHPEECVAMRQLFPEYVTACTWSTQWKRYIV